MDARLILDALVTGLPYAFNFVGVWLVYRLLKDFDLTVDGSFTLGAGISAVLITSSGWNPIAATFVGGLAGAGAGLITAMIHLRMGVSLLLSGIITMIALWSVNLRVMGLPNLSFFGQETIFTPFLGGSSFSNDLRVVAVVGGLVLVAALALGLFLKTELGLSMRATGANPLMARSVGIGTGLTVFLFLMISNFLVGFSGAVTAQQQVFADINMGIGVILVAITAILLGELVVRRGGSVWLGILAVVVGTVLYHIAVAVVVRLGLRPSDLRAFTAFVLIVSIGASMLISRSQTWLRIRRREEKSAGLEAVRSPAEPTDQAEDQPGGRPLEYADQGSLEEGVMIPTASRAASNGLVPPREAGRRNVSSGTEPLSLRGIGVVYNRGLPNEVVALRSVDLDVLPGRERGHEVEVLEDEAECARAEGR